VPWTYYERTADAIERVHETGMPIVGIEVTPEAIPMPDYMWPRPVAILFGNEVSGVNEKTLARCDAVVCIPMHGFKNSINIATAFGIILFDVLRQWDALRRK
jgi:tRNA G18 (ribose-2'-O)-methylase SpoU